jgi:hypothetical protein
MGEQGCGKPAREKGHPGFHLSQEGHYANKFPDKTRWKPKAHLKNSMVSLRVLHDAVSEQHLKK